MAMALSGGSAVAQERTSVVIDYVSVEGVYVAVGTQQGLSTGDTLSIFADSVMAVPIGRLVFTSVTRRRSVARIVEPSLEVTMGDVLFLELGAPSPAPEPGLQAAPLAAAETETPSDAPAALRVGNAGPQMSGRLSLDVDARESRTSWAGDLPGETVRRFATPTARLSLQITDMPGGWTLRTNLRASYRYSELDVGLAPASVRAYEVAAIKSLESVPVEFRLGRFHNPYESYSAYWDGLLVRVGGVRGLGGGVAAGFEPNRFNEGFSSERPKLTGFVDFAARGRSWRYATDVSVHAVRPESIALDRTFAGWSQRLSAGPLTLSQRLRIDRSADTGSWSLLQLRLQAAVAIAGPLRLRSAYGRSRPGAFHESFDPTWPSREEISVGLGLYGPRASVSIDGGNTRWEGDSDGRSLSGHAGLTLQGVTAALSGRYWQRADMESFGASPSIAFMVGRARARIGYRFYETKTVSRTFASHGADLQLSAALSRSLRVTLRGRQQWGTNLAGTGISVGVWRTF